METTHIMHDTRRAILVGTWKGHARRQLNGSIALDLNLYAVGIELGATAGVDFERRIGFVQGNELAADEVAMKCQRRTQNFL